MVSQNLSPPFVFFVVGIFLTGFFSGVSPSFASQNAVVKSERAIIYADAALKFKLGYVSRGKLIRVGSVAKGINRKIFPILVDNKVAYIEKADLHVENENTAKEEQNQVKSQEFLQENNLTLVKIDRDKKNLIDKKILVGYGPFMPGTSWQNLSTSVGNNSFGLNGHLLEGYLEFDFFTVLGMGAGLNYLSISEKNLGLSGGGYQAGLNFNVATPESKNFYSLSGTYLYFPDATLKVLDNTYSLTLQGFRVAVQFNHEFGFHWVLRYGLGYYSLLSSEINQRINYQGQYNITLREISLQGYLALVDFIFRF